jgi:DNA primase
MADNRRVDFKGLRQRADFRAILAHHGLEPVGKGDQLKIRCCPFHDDHEPGCSSVNLTKRAFHCFGGGIEGNVPDFVHRLETGAGNGAVSIRQAALKLAEISSIEHTGATGARRGARKPKDGPAAGKARSVLR